MMMTLSKQDVEEVDANEREFDRIELKSWPKRIDHLEELPGRYLPYLQPWISKGMPVKHLTYIPREDDFCEQPEYVLCWMGEEVMMLKTDIASPGSSVKRIVLTPQSIIRIDYSVTLLHCQVVFTYREDGEILQEQFQYNRVKEENIVPVLNILLKNQPFYEMNVYTNENSTCQHLSAYSYAMFNSSKLAYRLDSNMECYYWDKKQVKYTRTTSPKRKVLPEYFIGVMNKGIALIYSDVYDINTIYLLWENIRGIWLIQEKNTRIVIETKQHNLYTVPVNDSRCALAQAFVQRIQGKLENVHHE